MTQVSSSAGQQVTSSATWRVGSTQPTVAIIGTRGYPSYYGGFETAVRKMSPYLVDQGWRVVVYSRPGATVPSDPARDHRVVSRMTSGFETRSLSTLSSGLTASLDAARHRPDVALVMNTANGYWLPILKARGIPTVVNVDGLEWERDKWGGVARGVFKLGARLTAQYASELIFDSTVLADYWRREFGADGQYISYGGDPGPPLAVEAPLKRRKYVLYVARFVPENSFYPFLDAARTLSHRYAVVLVGSSGYGDELDRAAVRLAGDSPNVHWLGHIHNDARLAGLWQNSGVYFHGHSVGGTNPALVQAMASGAPIVARDTAFNREVLGNDAVLTKATPVAIRQAIDRVMGDATRQDVVAHALQQRAAEHYSWETICMKYERLLRRVVERSCP